MTLDFHHGLGTMNTMKTPSQFEIIRSIRKPICPPPQAHKDTRRRLQDRNQRRDMRGES